MAMVYSVNVTYLGRCEVLVAILLLGLITVSDTLQPASLVVGISLPAQPPLPTLQLPEPEREK